MSRTAFEGYVELGALALCTGIVAMQISVWLAAGCAAAFAYWVTTAPGSQKPEPRREPRQTPLP